MDQNEQEIEQSSQENLGKTIYSAVNSKKAVKPRLGSTKSSVDTVIKDLFEEKRKHRKEMLEFVKGLTGKSFWLLAGLITAQSFTRLFVSPNLELVSPTVMNVLAVSVFGQVIGVLLVIIKSLWDDSSLLAKL